MEVTKTRFMDLANACEASGVSFDLSFNNGKYISGADIAKYNSDHDPSLVQQGASGWSITIGGLTDNELHTLDHALQVGLRIFLDNFYDR